MSKPVKFKLRIIKFYLPEGSKYDEEYSNLRVTTNDIDPTIGVRKNISTVYEDLSTVSDIVSKITEYFSNEKCVKFTKSGDSLTYDDDATITIDEDDLTERIEAYFDNMTLYGKATCSIDFDAHGFMETSWHDDTNYVAQIFPVIEED